LIEYFSHQINQIFENLCSKDIGHAAIRPKTLKNALFVLNKYQNDPIITDYVEALLSEFDNLFINFQSETKDDFK